MIKDDFTANLQKSLALIEEGRSCLENDRANSMENEVYKNMLKMKNTCDDFLNFQPFL